MGKNSEFGSGMKNPDLLPRAQQQFFVLKYLNSLKWIRYPEWKNPDPGWKKFGSQHWVEDK
jgi:hypothetical protein